MNFIKNSIGILTNSARIVLPLGSGIRSSAGFISNSFEKYRLIHTSSVINASHFKARDRKDLLRTVGKLDEGTEGEKVVSLVSKIQTREDMFTDENTPDLLFNGIPFKYIPVVSIYTTKNNTHINVCDGESKTLTFRSNGAEGFKNCRKGTNVAAQSTALWIANKSIKMGLKDVRLKIRGLGPGRMAAIKGLQMGGLNIISVTDDTRISWRPSARPRKPRRV